jgi:diguanylate cyclase (GGDEF)-like protein/PAS domain S-box-containing protein
LCRLVGQPRFHFGNHPLRAFGNAMQPKNVAEAGTSIPGRFRWLTFITATVIAAIVLSNALILAHLYRTTVNEVQRGLLRQSLTLSELTERTFQSINLVLDSIADKIQKEDGVAGEQKALGSEAINGLLAATISGLPQLNAMGIVDANGTRLNYSRLSPITDFSYREYFRVPKQNPTIGYFIAEPVLGRRSGVWELMMSRPLRGKDGHFMGVVYASVLLSYFENLFQSTSLGEGYATTLMRDDGTLLARYPEDREIGRVALINVMKRLGDAKSVISRTVSPTDGKARFAAAFRLATYPLIVVSQQTEAAALANWRKTLMIMSLVTGFVIAVILFSAFVLGRFWKQQARLQQTRTDLITSENVRALAEADLSRERELARQNERFTAAVENIKQGLSMFDAEMRLVVSNKHYACMYRLPQELTRPGASYDDIIAYCMTNGVIKHCDVESATDRHVSKLVQLSPTEKSVQFDEHADGQLVRIIREPTEEGGWVAIHEDITEQRKAELELDETKRFLDSIIKNIPIAVVVKDAQTLQYVLVNQAFEQAIAMPAEELTGRTAFDIYNAEDAGSIDAADREALLPASEGITIGETRAMIRSRGQRIYTSRRIVMHDKAGRAKYLICVIEDITERKQAEQRIAYLAHHDALTGLSNRVALVERIEEAVARQRRRSEPFSVLMLDLDRFKQVNDTLGHPAGDKLLSEVAIRLKALLRETDVLARLGGDEFAIIQADESEQRAAATTLAKRIIETLADPFMIGSDEVTIGASIGIALAPEHAGNSEDLLKMADLALYQVKATGRNGHRFFEAAMGESASARHAVEADLRRAIEQGEFELHYQPIIDAKTHRICSAEALIRWRHPVKGMIYPDQFISLAEETGLIGRIGEWVLRTACADAARWPTDVKVAINVSPLQFRGGTFLDVVLGVLAETTLAPERLEIEITETAVIGSAVECLPLLRQFKSKGITIVLDDFGTGYSSLSQIATFPFDKIKIDKSFTQNLTKRSECAAIVSATLHLSQSLNMATTAEGVETIEQYRLLKLAGVTSVQGYLFKRPCPLSEMDFGAVFGELEQEAAA